MKNKKVRCITFDQYSDDTYQPTTLKRITLELDNISIDAAFYIKNLLQSVSGIGYTTINLYGGKIL